MPPGVIVALPALLWSAGPIVHLNPVTISVSNAGEQIIVEVAIEDVNNLGGFQFDLAYKSSVVHGQGAELGAFLSSTGRAAIPLGPQINASEPKGKLTFGGASFGANPGPNGSGVLAKITLQGQAFGADTLKLENILLSDIYGNPIVGVKEKSKITLVPGDYPLLPNYPNPFNPSAILIYRLSKSGRVSLQILNSLGQVIRTLVDREAVAGTYESIWDATDDGGQKVVAGVYLAQFRVSNVVRTRKLVYVPHFRVRSTL